MNAMEGRKMDRVENYGVYRNSYYGRTQSQKDAGSSKVSGKSTTKKTDQNSQVNLSENAKKLLNLK